MRINQSQISIKIRFIDIDKVDIHFPDRNQFLYVTDLFDYIYSFLRVSNKTKAVRSEVASVK